MKRIVALPALAVALLLAAVGALAGSLSPAVPKASAYLLANGCDEYDPDRGKTYRCTPDRTTFYTPDGINPNAVSPGTTGTINDTLGIPPPAPYRAGKDYCSNPEWTWSYFESLWQPTCYNHDVCYGSQLGRTFCDVNFWKGTIGACKANYGWYHPFRYWCFSDAGDWYLAVRIAGGSHYKPRRTSFEP